jgi:predicted house-cleaning NTP pyrophosphatase (Maf/HAM1 superfamily)
MILADSCLRSIGECFEGVAIAKQHFTSVPDELINALIKKGAIFTCAGGFTVEDMTEYCGYVSSRYFYDFRVVS